MSAMRSRPCHDGSAWRRPRLRSDWRAGAACGYTLGGVGALDVFLRLSPDPESVVMSSAVANSTAGDDLAEVCVREESISRGDWLSLARYTYIDRRGVPKIWEGATRLTRNDDTKIDAVGVIAFYRRLLHYDCIILVKQYRPALKTYTIEMPSGLVQENETPAESAVRELKEITGFSGSIKKIGPILAMDPGASNCAMRLVTIEVDGDYPDNLHLKGNMDNERFKEALLIPVSELLDKLSAFAAAGFIIDSRIDAFAIGLVMGNQSRKNKIPTTLM